MTVKRRTEETADQVRVMTVHGAKGLEAPIVILPDTAIRSDGRNPPQILRLDHRPGGLEGPRRPRPPGLHRRRGRPPRASSARRAAASSTSASPARSPGSSSAAPAPTPPPSGESWHTLVREAMPPSPPPASPAPTATSSLLAHNWPAAPAAGARAAPAAPPPLPDWARRPARPPASAPRAALALRPRRRPHARPASPASSSPRRRPRPAAPPSTASSSTCTAAPPPTAPALAGRLLPATPDLAALLAEVEAILDAPGLAFLFAPGTLAEVDVTAPLAALGGARILGRIDRLLVEPGRVLAVDFKSHQAVPATPEAVPEGILRQMGAYQAALAAVFPGRRGRDRHPLDPRRPPDAAPAALTAAALARAGLPANGRLTGCPRPLLRRPNPPRPPPERSPGMPARPLALRGLRRPRPRPPGALAPRPRRDPRRRRLARLDRRSSCPSPRASTRSRLLLLAYLASFAGLALGTAAAARLLQRRAPVTLLGPGGFRPRHFAARRRRRRAPRPPLRAALAGVAAARSASSRSPPGPPGSPSRSPLLLVQTAAEELAFRGYLMQSLAARFASRWVWLLLPALLFGALHWNPAEFGANAWLVALSTTVVGLVLADVTAKTGNLSAAIGLHFANNVTSLLVVSLPGPLAGLSLWVAPPTPPTPRPRDRSSSPISLITLLAWAAWRPGLRRRLHSRSRGSI